MLVADLLLDSATTEVSMYQQAREACHKVTHYVYDGHEPEREVNWRDKDFYVYHSHNMGIEQDFLIWIGPRQEHTVGMSGMYANFSKPIFGSNRVIIIWGMRGRPNTLQELRATVNSTNFLTVFEHEFLHLLDADRTKNGIMKRTYPDASDHDRYYNDPAEFNAYYHDIAKDMMAVIDAAAKSPEDAKDYMELFGMTGNWQDDIPRMLTHDLATQRFVKSLRPERRRALMRRLYRLHQQMIAATRG
jgi:hypothetical protein